MKVIDLYNKIANKEEIPKKIKFENNIYIYNEYDEFYYINGNPDNYTLFDRVSYFDMTSLMNFLNDEVEIIEDTPKKIKLDHFKSIEELKKQVDSWIENDELDWTRWFSLYDLKELIDYKNKGE